MSEIVDDITYDYFAPGMVERIKQGLIESVHNTRIDLLPEYEIVGFKTNIFPREYLLVPERDRCCRITKQCEYIAVVRVHNDGGFQYCPRCYIALVRGVMQAYPYYLRHRA